MEWLITRQSSFLADFDGGMVLLSELRYKIILIFVAALLIFVIAGIGMLTAPPPSSQTWHADPEAAADVFNAARTLSVEFFTRFAPSLSKTISHVYISLQDHLDEVETLTGFILSRNPNLSYQRALRIASALKDNSTEYGLPLDLVVGVTYTESRFNPHARSAYGASGLMQVVWRIHDELLIENGIPNEFTLLEPESGSAAGCLLLSQYINESENLTSALGKYYGGDGNSYWIKVSRVMEEYKKFKSIFNEEVTND